MNLAYCHFRRDTNTQTHMYTEVNREHLWKAVLGIDEWLCGGDLRVINK